MDFYRFLKLLRLAEKQSSIENAYSHLIWDILWDVFDEGRCSVVDVCSWRKGVDERLVPKDIIATPDFVVSNLDYCFDDRQNEGEKPNIAYGCIEVKFDDKEVLKPARLEDTEDTKGYLNAYKKVIYTNGWIWEFYNGSPDVKWSINFRENPILEEYYKLKTYLKEIDWKN